MKTNRPIVKIVKQNRKRADGTFPIYIHVNWRGTRANEATKINLSEKDFKSGLYRTKSVKKRLSEIEDRIDELMSERKPFTANDCLDKPDVKTNPIKVLSELSSLKKLGPRTIKCYSVTIKSLKKYFGDCFSLSDLTLHQIQGWARYTKLKPSTTFNYLKRVKSLLQFCVERGYLVENVMSGWNFRAEGYKAIDKPKSRTRSDISEIIKHFENGNEAAGIWLSGYFFCGLALTDLCRVDWKKVERTFIEGAYYFTTKIYRKKTNEVASIVTPIFPLTEKLYSFLLTEPWKGFSEKQYDAYIYKRLQKIDKKLSYYQCRHSFCSMMVASGAPINSIASLMGRSVNGISAYVQRITENSTLAKATAALKRTEILETPPEDLFE